jgi:hypothetical protein
VTDRDPADLDAGESLREAFLGSVEGSVELAA